MKKQYLKTIGSTLIVGAFLFLAFGSDETENSDANSNSNEVKTSFSNCDELLDYVRPKGYNTLKSDWGGGAIDEPWDASGVGELKMRVNVKWNNIKCNGKSVEITFVNNYTSLANSFDKNPGAFNSVYCGDYK